MTHRRWGLRAVVALLALGSALTGCRDPDPGAELRTAAEATAADTFTFAITAHADRAALDGLGGGAADAAAFLRDLVVDGERDDEGDVRVGLRIGGEVPLLEALTSADGRLFLRTGLPELLGASGADVEGQLGPALDEAGVGPEGRAALVASFAGGWIALSDVGGLGELLDERARETGAAVDDVPPAAGDLDELLAATRVTAARTAGDVRRLDVEVTTAAFGGLLGDPGEVAEVLPGTVVLRDGRITEVRLDLAPEGEAGTVELVATFADHGADVRLTRPEAAVSLTGAQLVELATQLETAGALPAP